METAMIILGIANASIAGTALGYWGLAKHEEQKIARSYRLQAGAEQRTQLDQGLLEVKEYTEACSYRRSRNPYPPTKHANL